MWSRIELKEDSKSLLRLNYWPFVLVAFICSFISAGSNFGGARSGYHLSEDALVGDRQYQYGYAFDHHMYSGLSSLVFAVIGAAIAAALGFFVVSLVLSIFVFHPLEVGCIRFMTIAREVKPEFQELLFAFKNCYGNVVKIMFLRNLYIFLWSLLLVIPGIVKSYEYRMVSYLLAEYPDMDASEAFRISREMMYGNKWEAFVLDLSFLGWDILSVCTMGLVGVFYAGPYKMLTDAALYLTLKKTHPSFGYVQPDDRYYYHNGQY